MSEEEREMSPGAALIKEQLRRSFQEKASEDLPPELMDLIGKLREQDNKNGR